MAKEKTKSLVPPERIASRIYLIRGQKVMLDFDLAELYGVETRALNQAVTRNIDRFPEDFAFQFTRAEFNALMSQIVISNAGRGGQGAGDRNASRNQPGRHGGMGRRFLRGRY